VPISSLGLRDIHIPHLWEILKKECKIITLVFSATELLNYGLIPENIQRNRKSMKIKFGR
jgi:hypothetical protein